MVSTTLLNLRLGPNHKKKKEKKKKMDMGRQKTFLSQLHFKNTSTSLSLASSHDSNHLDFVRLKFTFVSFITKI